MSGKGWWIRGLIWTLGSVGMEREFVMDGECRLYPSSWVVWDRIGW